MIHFKKQLTKNEFIRIMQDIGINGNTSKYSRCEPIINQQYKTFDTYPQDLTDLINFFKGLVLCERDFNWVGGSVASNLFAFREISKHPFMMLNPMRLDDLTDWALKSRGNNGYTPLGSWRYESCRSINDVRERNIFFDNKRKFYERQQSQIAKIKAKKNSLREKLNELRPLRRYLNKQTFNLNIKMFLLLSTEEQLKLILKNKLNFPINLIPNECLVRILKTELDINQINTLLSLIPRRTSEFMKTYFKKDLIEKKKLKQASN